MEARKVSLFKIIFRVFIAATFVFLLMQTLLNAQDGELYQSIKRTIYWQDNNNEKDNRPTLSSYQVGDLTVTIEGTEYTKDTITDDLLKRLGGKWPEATVKETGVNVWTMDYGNLPTKIYDDHQLDENGDPVEDGEGNPVEPSLEITWNVPSPTNISNYEVIDGANASGYYETVDKESWYYLLEEEIPFYIDLRRGSLVSLPDISDAIMNQFSLGYSTDVDDDGEAVWTDISLSDLMEEMGYANVILEAYENGDWKEWDPEVEGKNPPDKIRITVLAPRYTVNGKYITYRLAEDVNQNPDNRLDYDNSDWEMGDYFAISYDNTNAVNHGSDTDGAYKDGSVILTLTGTIQYNATKVWQDENADDRPEIELELWRYRAGEGINTAAAVRDENGEVYSQTIDGSQKSVRISFPPNQLGLPKYDAEGYRYIYVVREYGLTSDYEQVFGTIDEDGNIQSGSDVVFEVDENTGKIINSGNREDGNTYLYNGGTLNNVRSGTKTATVTKIWHAASFQTEFEGVAIELTLQGRALNSQEEWTEIKDDEGNLITMMMEDFNAENLAGVTKSMSVPKYNNLGEELEYRWIESGVYQGDRTENLLNGDQFTLIQSTDIPQSIDNPSTERSVDYTSNVTIDDDGNTVITNEIKGEIYYRIDKWWQLSEEEIDAIGEDALLEDPTSYKKVDQTWYGKTKDGYATFDLYRLKSGEMPSEEALYLTFIMGKEQSVITYGPKDGANVSIDILDDWKVQINGLAEFDEMGYQYEYILIEKDTVPDEETHRFIAGYDSSFYNPIGPGDSIRILVQKRWIDSSDTGHRQPVTIQAYNKKTNQPIAGASVQLSNGIWYDWINITLNEEITGIDDVYLLETYVGDAEVDNKMTSSNQWPESVVGEVITDYHHYDVMYSDLIKIEGTQRDYRATVTNRRLGNVNLTVNKVWNSGDGTQANLLMQALEEAGMDLALRLQFDDSTPATDENGFKITYNKDGGDTVTVGNESVPILDQNNNPTSSIQIVDVPGTADEKTAEYYFFDLPKYDLNGDVVRYTVVEGLIDAEGNFYTISQYRQNGSDQALIDALQSWDMDVSLESYSSAVDDHTQPNHDQDTQVMKANNALTGVKDVEWHKEWKDIYAYENGLRPDIYLDIYQIVHKSADENDTKLELFQKDYRWHPQMKMGETDGAVYNWTAIFENLPLYDAYGYEITYYAVERTMIDASAFDYQPVQYWWYEEGKEPVKIGDRLEVEDEQTQYVADLHSLNPYGESIQYALIEGGTFRNSISAGEVLAGQKLWTNVPDAFAKVDLPDVTFAIYQSYADKENTEDPSRIASLTITDWASVYDNGSYSFTFLYQGNWKMEVKNGSTIYTNESNQSIEVSKDGSIVYKESDGTTVEHPEWAKVLPKYDENGNRYAYTMKEESIDLNGETVDIENGTGEAKQKFEEIFSSASVVNGTYQANNTYKVDQDGQLTVQKWLKLEAVNGQYVFPSITVTLERTYESDLDVDPVEQIATYTWTSADVKAAYEQQKEDQTFDESDPWVLLPAHTFDNLAIYTANGKPYQYTIKEETNNLNGYDTWVVKRKVTALEIEDVQKQENAGTQADTLEATKAIEGVEDSVDVTFINSYEDSQETVEIQGKKEWRDWDDLFGLRPTIDQDGNVSGISLTVTRSAPSQPGQNNAIAEHEINCTVSWEEDSSNPNQWIYTISGNEYVELARYAPNGMPWVYKVTEKITDEKLNKMYGSGDKISTFDMANATAEVVTNNDPLINSMQKSISYQKTWINSDGETMSDVDEYFDTVSVEVQLLVSEDNGTTWQTASSYFTNIANENFDKIFASGETFVRTLPNNEKWNGSFTLLPSAIKDEQEELYFLSYRVVETKISYSLDGTDTTITVSEDQLGSGNYTLEPSNTLISGASGTNTNIRNTLETVELQITKNWTNDNQNDYQTRPDHAQEDWMAAFLVQYSDDGKIWHTYRSQNDPMIVTLTGDDADRSASIIVKNLPGITGRKYRAVELQSDYDTDAIEDYILEEGDRYHNGYIVSYGENPTEGAADEADFQSSITNALEVVEVHVIKDWMPSQLDHYPTVTMQLQYLASDGKWKDLGNGVSLNGTETEPWNYTWSELPKYLPNSDLSKGATQYRVNENSGDYVIVGNSDPVIDKDGNYTITFTNQLTTSFTVTKLWEDAPNDVQDWNVEVGLYRYTDEKGTLEEDAVLDEDGNAITCVLSGEQAPSGWSHRFTNLAKYDADGKEYHYYVQELSVNGVKVDADSGTVNDLNFVISYAQTTTGMTITNRAVEEISVQKYWWGETGQEVKVALYMRSYDAQGNEVLQEVNDPSSPEVTPYVLTLNAAGNWQGTFVQLAPYDANGNKIEYVIRELDAADQPIEANGKWNDEYTVSYEEHAIYNVGYGDLKITKTLAGNAAETDKTFHFEILLTAPEDHPDLQKTTFTYVRYDQAGEEIESGTITRDGQLELKGNESLIIQDIPADYRYEVKEVEANQNGYTTISDGASGTIEVEECAEATFVNAREPYDLLIVKKVTGIGDKEKEFHFTLSLKDAQGNDLTGTIAYSREDGSTGELTLDEYGTCTFVLSDGQSIMIEDLPNGTTYVIKEEEANKDGYITTVQEEIRDTIEGSIDTNQIILFVNDLPKETSPSDPPSGNGQSTQDTGTINSVIFYSVLGIMAGDAVIFATILRKKRKNK